MKKTINLLTLALILGLTACNSSNNGSSDSQVAEMPNITGKYHGILPCGEDCSGAIAEVEISSDNAIALRWMYLGDSEDYQNLEGSYSWNDDGTKISSTIGGETFHFSIGENSITKLNDEGEAYTGEDADLYILIADEDDKVANRLWQIVKVGDAEVGETPHEAFIVMNNNARIMGNTGCNSLNGKYDLTNVGLSFGPIAVTKMLCQNVPYENDFLLALNETDGYKVEETMLHLRKGDSTMVVLKEEEIER